MPPFLLDTSNYISALRRGGYEVLALRTLAHDGPLWLSAVVLEELYAGASERGRKTLERMEQDFKLARLVVTPNLADWVQAGKVLARLAAKYDYERIGRGRLTNDALIAMSAARLNIKVITANARDFGRLAEFRKFQWQIGGI
jgi:predicted nucleic acid-binding protein